jgi:hypothetical protein
VRGNFTEANKGNEEMKSIGQSVIDEIITQGIVWIEDHPDPDGFHVFRWRANAADQLNAKIAEVVRSCQHPPEKRMSLGSHYEWCGVCGAVRRTLVCLNWQLPDVI